MNLSFVKKVVTAGSVCLLLSGMSSAYADAAADVKRFQGYYLNKFKDTKIDDKPITLQDFADGVYAIDSTSRETWTEIEEMPPYEIHIDDGKAMWDKKFANGKGYASCFADGPAMMHKYPHWDKDKSMVMTLPLALNNCLKANGEKPMKYKKGPINNILAYIAFESRGNKINVEVPSDDAKAVAAYNKGKQFWLSRRGQLNMSCAACHAKNPGLKVRGDLLSPALGHVSHFPVYRAKWGTVGTLHRRFSGCNKQVRAKPFKAQGEEYRNLEYFLTAMSNGIELNGPSSRK